MHAVTEATRLDGEAVRDVKVLERFAILSVPADEVERVVREVGGTRIRGVELRLEPARAS